MTRKEPGAPFDPDDIDDRDYRDVHGDTGPPVEEGEHE
jgi:hypothetical protein